MKNDLRKFQHIHLENQNYKPTPMCQCPGEKNDLLGPKYINTIQQVLGILLYYGIETNNTIIFEIRTIEL